MYTQCLASFQKRRSEDDEFTPTSGQQPGKRDELAAQRKACEQSARNLYARVIQGEASVGELARHASLSAQPALSASLYSRQLQAQSAKTDASLITLQQAFTPTTGGLPLASPPSFAFSRQPTAAVNSPAYFQRLGLHGEPINPHKASPFYRPLTPSLTNKKVMEEELEYSLCSIAFYKKIDELLERGDNLPEKERESYRDLMEEKMMGEKYHFFRDLKKQGASWLPKGVEWLDELDRYSEKILEDHIAVASGWKDKLTYKEPRFTPYLVAPVTATWKATKDLIGMAAHPLDRLVRPMAHLARHPIDGISYIFRSLNDHSEYICTLADGPEAVEMVVQAFIEWTVMTGGASAASRVLRTKVLKTATLQAGEVKPAPIAITVTKL